MNVQNTFIYFCVFKLVCIIIIIITGTSNNNLNQVRWLHSKWLPQSAVPADTECTARSLLHVAISLRKEWHSAGKEPGTVSMYGRRTSLYRAFHSCVLSAFMSVAASGCHLRAALHPNHTHMTCILQWSCILRLFVRSCETRSSTNFLTTAGRPV
jgi:hypothetical protein